MWARSLRESINDSNGHVIQTGVHLVKRYRVMGDKTTDAVCSKKIKGSTIQNGIAKIVTETFAPTVTS